MAFPRTGRPAVRARRGMIATPHYLASATGLDVLRRGGSAVDAAIAANAVLCVAYPHMTGLGGDGFWLLYDPETEASQAINASGPAAARATRAAYHEHGDTDRPPTRGARAALTVPGIVDGWRLAHDRYGRLAWPDLFADAIHYARSGVAVSRSLAAWTARDEAILRAHPATARIYLCDNRPHREGERLVQAALGRSFERLAQQGPRAGFYEGETARLICAALAPDGSPLRPDDFAAYRAEWIEPITTTYREHTVYELPPNAQGFTALHLLDLLEGYDVGAWGDGSAAYYHHLAEAARLALADRDAWLADPRFAEVPFDRLRAKGYAERRRALVDPQRTMARAASGLAHAPRMQQTTAGGDTCAFCCVDERGLVVSAIASLYHDFGAGVVGGASGVLLQNRGAAFSLHDAHPNRLEPGKRPAHTLIPALLARDGRPVLAFGTMGGDGQPQTQAALVTRCVDFGYDVQQAIEAPRGLWGRTWGEPTEQLALEGRAAPDVVEALTRRGHRVRVLADWDETMGHAQAIRIGDGFLEGGADPRGDGLALGF